MDTTGDITGDIITPTTMVVHMVIIMVATEEASVAGLVEWLESWQTDLVESLAMVAVTTDIMGIMGTRAPRAVIRVDTMEDTTVAITDGNDKKKRKERKKEKNNNNVSWVHRRADFGHWRFVAGLLSCYIILQLCWRSLLAQDHFDNESPTTHV
jgi:hypothetical protein